MTGPVVGGPVAGGRVVRTPVQTRFADLDALGHVNNVAFFTFMETGRLRWFEDVRFPAPCLVARSECDLKAEISAQVRTVDVDVSCSSVGRTSFVVAHELSVDGRSVASGRVVMVKIGEDRRPAEITAEERALLLAGG